VLCPCSMACSSASVPSRAKRYVEGCLHAMPGSWSQTVARQLAQAVIRAALAQAIRRAGGARAVVWTALVAARRLAAGAQAVVRTGLAVSASRAALTQAARTALELRQS
jgi:hypothetical protein